MKNFNYLFDEIRKLNGGIVNLNFVNKHRNDDFLDILKQELSVTNILLQI